MSNIFKKTNTNATVCVDFLIKWTMTFIIHHKRLMVGASTYNYGNFMRIQIMRNGKRKFYKQAVYFWT